MPTVQKSIRIQHKTIKEIERIAKQANREFSSVTNELLDNAIKMQRVPGIVFSEGTTGLRARIAGTGIEVWELIATYKSVNNDLVRLRKAYHWLTEQQLRAAIGYYRAYPEEINSLMELNEQLTEDTIFEKYPFLAIAGN
ncbi:MAG: DUF433 domain-containing protein [Nitrospirae bacterium]|nr:DUF433 domain-containing protein [Nitrospirota bacterium]